MQTLRQSNCYLAVVCFNNADATAHFKHCSKHEAGVFMIFNDEDEWMLGARGG